MLNPTANQTNSNQYPYIDIGKMVFACLIPLLHIPVAEEPVWLMFLRQYIARLGVPFFFCVSGFFLGGKISREGGKPGLQQIRRIFIMLLLWLVVYSPFLFSVYKKESFIIVLQTFLFKTPAYLWYLSAYLFGIILFIPYANLRAKSKWVVVIPTLLYVFGTFYSESYTWLSGGITLYQKIFLTTRNGLFFAFPLMCSGSELVHIQQKQKDGHLASFLICILTLGCLWVEIFFVRNHVPADTDTSMYFLLPIFTCCLVNVLSQKPIFTFDTKAIRGMSTAIYLCQYGVLVCISYFSRYVKIGGVPLISWALIILVGILFYLASRRITLLRKMI